jgi:hypothetical protein
MLRELTPGRAVAVLAHDGAQPTIDAFLPRWRALGVPLIGMVPLGHAVRGLDQCRQTGQNAILGGKIFQRFLWSLASLEANGFEAVTVMEYDTLNRRDTLPVVLPGGVTSNEVMAPPHGSESGPLELLSFSPWTFDRVSLPAFIKAGWESLRDDPDCKARQGILDRWIGLVIQQSGLPHGPLFDGTGWPKFPGAPRWVANMNLNWVHGWKTRGQFGEAWPEEENAAALAPPTLDSALPKDVPGG